MVVVVVVGLPGSGKDVFVKAAMEMDFAHVRMGDVVRGFAMDLGLGADDSSVGGFADDERKVHGKDIWAVRTVERLPDGDVVIDGSRSLFEIERFRKELDRNLRVVAVDAPDEQRFQRLKARGREDDPVTMEEFRTRDVREKSWGIMDAIASADILLTNDSSLEEFRAKCLAVLEKL